MARQVRVALARIADLGAAAFAAARKNLGPRDRRRLAALSSARRRREFLAGRWLLGHSSRAMRTRVPLRFDASPHGGVEASARHIAASVSHSRGWVACALLERGAVGVDLEPMVPRDFTAAGQWAFGIPTDSPRDFYGRWTRYEARLKARREADASYWDRTYFLGRIALSICAPRGAAVRQLRRLAAIRR
ncbi:MAG TPA: hypothetical protein VF943_03560 [Burkholderiales bacterium]